MKLIYGVDVGHKLVIWANKATTIPAEADTVRLRLHACRESMMRRSR